MIVFTLVSYFIRSLQSLLFHIISAIKNDGHTNNPKNADVDPSTPIVAIVATGFYYPPNRIDPGYIEKVISTSYDLNPMYAFHKN